MKLDISYKKGSVPLEIDDSKIIKIVEPNDVPTVDEESVIKNGLDNPVGACSFDSFLDECEKLLVIVNDGTRPTPTAGVLKQIHGKLMNKDVRFIIATGVHRAPTEEEYRFIFGDLYDIWKDRVWAHDARNDEMEYLGVSSNGTEMMINSKVTEYEKVLIIGSVEPHYFAGYTGGRKSFLPGVSSYKTIEMNHKHALHSDARALKLEGNPVHEDMLDALKTLKCEVFSIQAVLDKKHRIYGLTSGDINESFFAAIDKAQEIFVAEIPEKADVVLSVAGYPMDVDLYQSQKALDNGKLALKDGGILIMVSSCREGLGEEAFFELLSSCDSPQEVLSAIKENYVLGYHKAGKMAEVNLWADVRAYSDLSDELWEKIFITPVDDLQKAVDDALGEKGPDAGIIVMTDGCMTVPKLRNNTMDKLKEEALAYHNLDNKPGKIEVVSSKPCTTAQELSLAYTPGVAKPVLEIDENPEDAYKYTSKGNLVAVISNGTAILGLGDRGALASKPVMEGKGVLFKRFADVDVFDIELDEKDPEKIIEVVKMMEPTFGGVNLEDIKSPECFEIEDRLIEMCDIPVFHDDQHGTAIIATAGLMNASEIAGKNLSDLKVVVNGAGAAGIRCTQMFIAAGVKHENVIMCDSHGVIYKGRNESMTDMKESFAVETDARTLKDVIEGADVFIGLSVADCLTPEMLLTMADDPIIFAMSNPNPEISPELAHATRDDIIMATGRSDYPNQINNVLGFPFIFRGALDVRARRITEGMKMAAAIALAELAKEPVPQSVKDAYQGKNLEFGREYLVPTPFDPRVIEWEAVAVAKAACDEGVAKNPITDWDGYRKELVARMERHWKIEVPECVPC